MVLPKKKHLESRHVLDIVHLKPGFVSGAIILCGKLLLQDDTRNGECFLGCSCISFWRQLYSLTPYQTIPEGFGAPHWMIKANNVYLGMNAVYGTWDPQVTDSRGLLGPLTWHPLVSDRVTQPPPL